MPTETEKFFFMKNDNDHVLMCIEDMNLEKSDQPKLIIDDKNHQCSFQYCDTHAIILNGWSEELEKIMGDKEQVLVVEDSSFFDPERPMSNKPSFDAHIIHINCF